MHVKHQFDNLQENAIAKAKTMKRVPLKKFEERVKILRKKIEKESRTAKTLFFNASIDRVHSELASESGKKVSKVTIAERLEIEWSVLRSGDNKEWFDALACLEKSELNTFRVGLGEMLYED